MRGSGDRRQGASRGRRGGEPERDRAEFRAEWLQLALDACAAAGGGRVDLEDLARRGCLARTAWTYLALPPEGGLCELLAVACHRFGRQRSQVLRQTLLPLLRGVAEAVIELHAATAHTAAPPADEPNRRLPYKDD